MSDSREAMKRPIGYLIEPHVQDCYFFQEGREENGRFPWVLPESTGITPPGHKRRKSLYVFRCNNCSCSAKIGIKSSDFHKILQNALTHLQEKGRPKSKRRKECA